MTLHDVGRLHAYWQRNPPLGIMVRALGAAFGVAMPEPVKPELHLTAEEAQRLFELTGGRIPGVAHG